MAILKFLNSHSTSRGWRSELKILPWTLLWVGSFLAANLGIEHGWLAPGWPVTMAALLTLLLGFGTVLAYRRYLKDADELRRKIELDALAIAFGAGLIGGITLSLLSDAGMVSANALITGVFTAMPLIYVAAVLVGLKRYA